MLTNLTFKPKWKNEWKRWNWHYYRDDESNHMDENRIKHNVINVVIVMRFANADNVVTLVHSYSNTKDKAEKSKKYNRGNSFNCP